VRVAIVSWHLQGVRRLLDRARLVETKSRPEAVIAYGGDGTLLWSEMLYPGIPKLFLHHSHIGKSRQELLPLLEQLASGDWSIENLPKLEGRAPHGTLVGMNDIYLQFHPPTALRFSASVNRKAVVKNAVGDGLVVSTPYGSSGYFHSITGRTFRRGIGVALNNCTRRAGPWFPSEKSGITVKVLRGPGWMVADSNRRLVQLRDGDAVRISKSKQPARIIHLRGRPLKIDVQKFR